MQRNAETEFNEALALHMRNFHPERRGLHLMEG